VDVGIGDKLFWVVIVGGALSVLVFILVKIGERVVKRRTAALLEQHGVDDEGEDKTPED
jgi:hypothetical protein